MNVSKKQRGFSLIEFLIIVGLAALVIYAILSRSSTARTETNTNNATTDVALLLTAPAKARPSQDFTGITATELCHQLPSALCPGGTAIAFGDSSVAVTATTVSGLSNTQFSISNVGAQACRRFGSMHSQMTQLTVGSTPVKSPTVTFSETALNGACGADAVTFVFSTRGT